jgi:transposase
MPKKYRVKLTKAQRETLQELVSSGSIKVRKYKRARVLLLADEARRNGAKTDETIAEQADISLATIHRIRRRFVEEGLKAALNEKARPGAPPKFSGQERAEVTALACSEPPEGYGRWTLRLLADKLIELEILDNISYDTVDRVLKKTNLSLTSGDSGALES